MLPFDALVQYVGQVHARTYEAVQLLDDGMLAWRPRPGELTAGELALHISAARLMNAGTIAGKGTHYPGHALGAGQTAADVRRALLRSSKKTIAQLVMADLGAEVPSMSSGAVPAWRILVAGLIEHEVHHRSQLCEYLAGMGLEAPPLYGLHVEDLPR